MVNSDDEREEDASILEILEQHQQQKSYGQHLYQQKQKQHHEQQKQRYIYKANVAKKKTKEIPEERTKEMMKPNKVGCEMIYSIIDLNKNKLETKDVVDDHSFVSEVDRYFVVVQKQKYIQ